jgi:N-methylhydantoinase B
MRTDSEGAGRRRGAPGAIVSYGPKNDGMSAAYVTDGFHNPPRGTRGGGEAARSIPYRVDAAGGRHPLEPIAQVQLAAGELLGHELSGGGGYGDPLVREPDLVRTDVLSHWVSFARARDAYGVVFVEDVLSDALEVDEAATERRRAELRAPGDAVR